jgi:hypothetical protein
MKEKVQKPNNHKCMFKGYLSSKFSFILLQVLVCKFSCMLQEPNYVQVASYRAGPGAGI